MCFEYVSNVTLRYEYVCSRNKTVKEKLRIHGFFTSMNLLRSGYDCSQGGDTPGGDTPGGDTPGGDTPGGDTPGPGYPFPTNLLGLSSQLNLLIKKG